MSAENLSSLSDDRLSELKQEVETKEAELKEKNEPSHEDILKVFNGGERQTKWDVTEDIMEKAFRTLGIPDLDLTDDKVKKIEVGEIPNFDENRESGVPQIYYRTIMVERPRNIFEKLRDRNAGREPEMIPTGQVQVIVNLNNGDKPENNTVIIYTAKNKNGKVDTSDKEALSSLGTEEHFIKSNDPDNQSADSKLDRGEITTKDYRKQFQKENGISLSKHWEVWDTNIVKTADWSKSEKYKDELMARLHGEYVEALVDSQKRKEEILEETKRRLEEKKKAKKKLVEEDQDFDTLLNSLKARWLEMTEAQRKQVEGLYGFFEPEVEELGRKWSETLNINE